MFESEWPTDTLQVLLKAISDRNQVHIGITGLDLLSALITVINGVHTDTAAAPAPSAVQARGTMLTGL